MSNVKLNDCVIRLQRLMSIRITLSTTPVLITRGIMAVGTGGGGKSLKITTYKSVYSNKAEIG